MNLVHWNSLHPKKAILPTFLGRTPYFHSENQKPRTNNLHHCKAGTVAVILSLREGSNIYKKWCNNIVNAVPVEYTLYLASPHGMIPCQFNAYLNVQGWQKVPKGPRLAKDT